MEKFELARLDAQVQPAVVSVPNLEETVAQAKAVLKQYEDFPVVEETEKQAKAARAELNKAKKTVSDIRKDIEKQLLGNWPNIKAQLKDVEYTTDETAKMIGSQLKELDEEKKQSKMKMVQAEIDKVCATYNIDPDKIEFDQRWLNKTYPWGDMQGELQQQAEKIQTAMELLAMQADAIKTMAEHHGLEPDGYVAMINNGTPLAQVKETIENTVKARELQAQAKKERVEQARKAQAEAIKNATRVGDKFVNPESGEVVEPVTEHVADYRYDMKQLTDKEKQFLDKKFAEWDIKFTSKEL
ncbi:DUF1351 domain-containing protein [Weissella viridescens]|uniref:DUF1351 domain-containing protein n=1 Tax=Weissella viridescens TaxID=1629 RepID=UPI001D06B9BD|nr:DUF1351 domain-containing protein [Weissella viridescens]MCB6841023.1 DUF1351 domain-containing protein [Weissella viridescens]MCB6847758.1 DUF1351 domain-containing protein [Weissella viridescens]